MSESNPSVVLYVHDIRPTTATGIGHYCRYLAREIFAAGPAADGLEYRVGASPDPKGWTGPGPGFLTLRSRLPRRPRHLGWTAAGWPSADGFLGQPDLVHVLSPYTPVPTKARMVYTIHDLWPLTSPAWYGRKERWTFRKAVGQAAARASKLIVNSEVTAQHVEARLGVERNRIQVVHMAIDDRFFKPIDQMDLDRVARRYDIECGRYLVAVGTVGARKNLAPVIEALARLNRENRPLTLVAAGPPGLGSEQATELVNRLGLDQAVRFTGYVAHEDLPPLIAGALAMVHPAADEGFGMTPLEGMACGVPTAVSDAGALPEVVADASLLVPPHDPDRWAAAISRLRDDAALRSDLIGKGKSRAAHFTWPRVALETIAVHRQALSL